MKYLLKYLFNIHNVICSVFIFVVLYILAALPAQFEVLDPIGKALEDFQLSDIVFSDIRDNPPANKNIVLVNIRHYDREQIARQIERINKYEPAVVGIDAFFKEKREFEKDFRLMMALSQIENLIMVSKLDHPDEEGECFDTLKTSMPQFIENATLGFANFITSPAVYHTTREFAPHFCLNDSQSLSFSSEIVKRFDTGAFEHLMSRGNQVETINWRGNYTKFFAIDGPDLFDDEFDLSFLKDKIVLLGFLGEREIGEPSLEDTFFTPMNEIPGGRSVPDMFGVTVHANIISMVLDRDYIENIPFWLNAMIAVILVYLNVSLFMWVGYFYKPYYDIITKTLQLFEVIVLFAVNLIALSGFDQKVDLTIAIIAVVFCGDLTELYVGSLKEIGLNWLKKLKRRS